MAYNNGQTVTFNGPDGDEIRVRLEVNSKARRLILRLDERRREAVAIAPSRRPPSQPSESTGFQRASNTFQKLFALMKTI